MKKYKKLRILKKYLITILVTIIALLIIQTIYTNKFNPIQTVRYAESSDLVIGETEYVITEQMVKSKLETRAQIVSLEQNLNKKETYVDDKFFGERKTELVINGTYKMGLNTGDITVRHIDSANRIVYLELPKPILISLEIPYDKVNFDKKAGWMRRKMNDKEKASFYKSAVENIRLELENDEELNRQARLFNQDVVESILTSMTEIKSVVFE